MLCMYEYANDMYSDAWLYKELLAELRKIANLKCPWAHLARTVASVWLIRMPAGVNGDDGDGGDGDGVTITVVLMYW